MGKTDTFEFAGFWKRVLAALADAAIGWVFMPIIIPIMVWSLMHRSVFPHLLFTVVYHVVYIFMVVRYGGTPGKLLVRLRVVEKAGNYLSWTSAIIRTIPYLIISANSILQFHYVTNTHPGFTTKPGFMEIGRAINQYGGIYTTLGLILGLFIYLDIGAVLFNKKKRAIHDLIAGSYVVTKASYLNAKTAD